MSRSGLVWYIGPPGCGKTYRAMQDARDLIRTTGYPLLVVDSQGVDQLARVPHVDSVEEAIERVWGQGEHAALIPATAADVEALCRAALDVGRVIFLIDESAYWLSSKRGTGSALLRIMRAHRHCRVHVLLTTQHFSGDVPQEALACAPTILASRVTSPAALAVLQRWYGADPAHLAAVPPRTFLALTLDPAADERSTPGVDSRGGAADEAETPSPVSTTDGAPPPA